MLSGDSGNLEIDYYGYGSLNGTFACVSADIYTLSSKKLDAETMTRYSYIYIYEGEEYTYNTRNTTIDTSNGFDVKCVDDYDEFELSIRADHETDTGCTCIIKTSRNDVAPALTIRSGYDYDASYDQYAEIKIGGELKIPVWTADNNITTSSIKIRAVQNANGNIELKLIQ